MSTPRHCMNAWKITTRIWTVLALSMLVGAAGPAGHHGAQAFKKVKRFQLTRTLLARGARPDTYAGKAAGHVLAMAAARGNTPIVKLLLHSGATANLQDDDGWHAMIFAAGAGDIEMMEALKSFGSDVNLSDHGGWTALMQAAKYGRGELVQWLIAKGASVQVRDKDGWTASSIAEKCGHEHVIRILRSRSV